MAEISDDGVKEPETDGERMDGVLVREVDCVRLHDRVWLPEIDWESVRHGPLNVLVYDSCWEKLSDLVKLPSDVRVNEAV